MGRSGSSMPHDVFLSYSSHDRQAAGSICEALEASGLQCWIAPRNIRSGQEWSEAIIDALNGSRSLVLLFSQHSDRSPQVLREVERAVSKRIPILPVRLEAIPLSRAMEYFLSVSHWFDAHGPSLTSYFPPLIETVRALLNRTNADLGAASPTGCTGPARGGHLFPTAAEPDHLPPLPGDLFGQDAELDAIVARLRGEARVVTLTGPAGCGKSRLALEVAHRLHADYADGARWVELGGVGRPDEVPSALLRGLHLADESATPLETVTRWLGGKQCLLVLDDCERVAAAVADAANQLLRTCPQVRLLVTSQMLLNLSQETPWPVPALPSEDAVQLFVSRARAVRNTFRCDGENRAIVQRICARLDGLPLAITLAATQVRLLQPRQIERQLEQRFRLLVSPFRDVSARQRTLRAALDASYDLLSPEAQTFFAALSCFRAPFTLEAAGAVTGSEEAYSLLTQLQEHSLLESSGDDETPRFRLLETIRAYTAERVAEEDRAPLAEAHARYFLDRFAVADPGSPDAPPEAGDGAVPELPDGAAALSWCLTAGRNADAVAQALALAPLWERQGAYRPGLETLRNTLTALSPEAGSAHCARLESSVGWFRHLLGDPTAAEPVVQALEAIRLAQDVEGECEILNTLGLLAYHAGRPEEARDHIQQSLRLAQALGAEGRMAARLSNLGLVEIELDLLQEAEQHLEEAVRIVQRLRHPHRLAVLYCNLAELALHNGDWTQAEALSQESLATFQRLGDRTGVLISMANLAEASVRRGEPDGADAWLHSALRLCLDTGLLWPVPSLLETRARAHAAWGHPEATLRDLLVAAAFRERQGMSAPPTVAAELAEVARAAERELSAELAARIRIRVRTYELPELIDQGSD